MHPVCYIYYHSLRQQTNRKIYPKILLLIRSEIARQKMAPKKTGGKKTGTSPDADNELRDLLGPLPEPMTGGSSIWSQFGSNVSETDG